MAEKTEKTTAPLGELSAKDAGRREMVLQGNMWRVMLYIGAPLALYQGFNMMYRILDTIMASHIGSLSVSAVAYLSQLQLMITALGGGLAVGASIKISAAYGAGDWALVKKRTSTLLVMCAVLSALVLLLIPFVPQLLRLTGTPEEFMASGVPYFIVSLVDIVLVFFGNVYIAVERARGNSRRILWLNVVAVLVKLSLTAFFVYVLHGDIVLIAVASLASDSVVFVAGLIVLTHPGSCFSFSLRAVSFRNEQVAKPMLFLSFPVMAEKVLFQLGKVMVNGMSTIYGATTVGALGISNNLGGLTTNPQNGFQEGGASIISQNLGAGNTARAVDAFKKLLVVNTLLGVLGSALSLTFLPQLASLFAADDEPFRQLICHVFMYEGIGTATLGVCAAVTGMLYGFGYTRLTMLINLCRVFVFRIPVLWALQRFTTLGSEAVGIVMMVSNIAVSVMAAVVAMIVMHRVCKRNNISFWHCGKETKGRETT